MLQTWLLVVATSLPILLALYYLALSMVAVDDSATVVRRFVRGLAASAAVAAILGILTAGLSTALANSEAAQEASFAQQIGLGLAALAVAAGITGIVGGGILRALGVESPWRIAAVQGAALAAVGLLYVLGPLGLAIDLAALVWLQVRWPAARLLGGGLGPPMALAGVLLFFVAAEFVVHVQDYLADNSSATAMDAARSFQSNFWTAQSGRAMLVQVATVTMAALGMTVIMISGGIDLSAGTAMALCATVIAWLLREGYSPILAVVGGLGTGLLTGLLNGALISLLRVVPFIVTLGTMTIYLGIGKLVADETTVRPALDAIPAMIPQLVVPTPSPAWLLLPSGIWLILLLAVILSAVLRFTVFGRHVFAVGSNEATARLCGINVARVKLAVYALGGLFVGMAGLYQFARLSNGDPTSGTGAELRIIAAVVIGGASLSGGRGTVIGTLAGAGIMAAIYNGCTMLGLQNPFQDIVVGVIIITAVALDQLRGRRLEA